MRANRLVPLLCLGAWSSLALAQIQHRPTTSPPGAQASASASGPASAPATARASASASAAASARAAASASASAAAASASAASSASAPASASAAPSGRAARAPLGPKPAPQTAPSSSASHGLTSKALPPPEVEEKPYEPARIYLEPGAFRFSLGVWGVRGQKGPDEYTTSIPWGVSAGFQLDPTFYLGINDVGYGAVDVPNGKRRAISWAPTFEKQFGFNWRNIDHFYAYLGVDIQHRWGAELDARSGYGVVLGGGRRWVARCSYKSRGCGAFFLEFKGYAAATDLLIQPVLLPQGAMVATFSLGFNGYRF